MIYCNTTCKAITVYADTKDEYTKFLTPEASAVLDEYLNERTKRGETLCGESPLFRSDYRMGLGAKPMNEQACTSLIYRLATRAQTKRKRQSKTRYTIQGAHSLRKRFNTILKSNNNINISLAERLMGHSQIVRLDNSYLVPSVERLFEEYKKAIPELTVSDEKRQKMVIEQQQQKISKLEEKVSDITAIKNKIKAGEMRMDELEDLLADLFEQYWDRLPSYIEQNPNPKAKSDPSLAHAGEKLLENTILWIKHFLMKNLNK